MPETLSQNTFINTNNNNISDNTSNSSCGKIGHQFSASCSNSSFISVIINKNLGFTSNNSDPIKKNSAIKEKTSSKSLSSSSTTKSKEDEEEDLFSATTPTTNQNTTSTQSTQSTFLLPSSTSFTSALIITNNSSKITQSIPSTINNITNKDRINSPQNTSHSSNTSNNKKTSDILKSTHDIASDHTVNFSNSNSNIQTNQINTSQKSDQLNFHTSTNTNTNTTTYSPVTPIGGGVGDSGSVNLTSSSDSSITSSSSSSSSPNSLDENFYKNKKDSIVTKDTKVFVTANLNSNKYKSTMIIDVLNKLYGSVATQNSNVKSSNNQFYPLKNKSQSLLAVVTATNDEHSQTTVKELSSSNAKNISSLTMENHQKEQQTQLVRNGIRKTFNNFYLLNAVPMVTDVTTTSTTTPALDETDNNDINIYSVKYNIKLFNNQIADKNNNLDSKVPKINFKLTQAEQADLKNDAKINDNSPVTQKTAEEKEQECVSFNNEAIILTQTDDLNLKDEKENSQIFVTAADERRVASYDLTMSTDQFNNKDNTTEHEEDCELDDEEKQVKNCVMPSKKSVYTGSKLALYHQKRQRKRLREKAFFSLKKKQILLNKTKSKGLIRQTFEEKPQSDGEDYDEEDNSFLSFSAEGLIQLPNKDQQHKQLTLDCIYTTTDATITSDESSSSSSFSTEAFNNTSLIVRSNSKTLSSPSTSKIKLRSASLKMFFKTKLNKKKNENKNLLLCNNHKALHKCFKSISGTTTSSNSSANSSNNSKCNSLSNVQSLRTIRCSNSSHKISDKEAIIGGLESGLFDDLIIDENPSIELNARADDDYDYDYDINEQIKSSDEDFTYSYGDLLMIRQDQQNQQQQQQQQQKQVNSTSNIISNEAVNDYSNTSKLEEDDEDDQSKLINKPFQILSLIVHRLPGEQLGLNLKVETDSRVLVTEISKTGASNRASDSKGNICPIMINDEILEINGVALNNLSNEDVICIVQELPLYVVLTLKRFEQKRKNFQRINRSAAANSLSISLSQTELNNNSPSTMCSRNNTPNLANIKIPLGYNLHTVYLSSLESKCIMPCDLKDCNDAQGLYKIQRNTLQIGEEDHLQKGDVLFNINGEQLTFKNKFELISKLSSLGGTAEVSVLRKTPQSVICFGNSNNLCVNSNVGGGHGSGVCSTSSGGGSVSIDQIPYHNGIFAQNSIKLAMRKYDKPGVKSSSDADIDGTIVTHAINSTCINADNDTNLQNTNATNTNNLMNVSNFTNPISSSCPITTDKLNEEVEEYVDIDADLKLSSNVNDHSKICLPSDEVHEINDEEDLSDDEKCLSLSLHSSDNWLLLDNRSQSSALSNKNESKHDDLNVYSDDANDSPTIIHKVLDDTKNQSNVNKIETMTQISSLINNNNKSDSTDDHQDPSTGTLNNDENLQENTKKGDQLNEASNDLPVLSSSYYLYGTVADDCTAHTLTSSSCHSERSIVKLNCVICYENQEQNNDLDTTADCEKIAKNKPLDTFDEETNQINTHDSINMNKSSILAQLDDDLKNITVGLVAENNNDTSELEIKDKDNISDEICEKLTYLKEEDLINSMISSNDDPVFDSINTLARINLFEQPIKNKKRSSKKNKIKLSKSNFYYSSIQRTTSSSSNSSSDSSLNKATESQKSLMPKLALAHDNMDSFSSSSQENLNKYVSTCEIKIKCPSSFKNSSNATRIFKNPSKICIRNTSMITDTYSSLGSDVNYYSSYNRSKPDIDKNDNIISLSFNTTSTTTSTTMQHNAQIFDDDEDNKTDVTYQKKALKSYQIENNLEVNNEQNFNKNKKESSENDCDQELDQELEEEVTSNCISSTNFAVPISPSTIPPPPPPPLPLSLPPSLPTKVKNNKLKELEIINDLITSLLEKIEEEHKNMEIMETDYLTKQNNKEDSDSVENSNMNNMIDHEKIEKKMEINDNLLSQKINEIKNATVKPNKYDTIYQKRNSIPFVYANSSSTNNSVRNITNKYELFEDLKKNMHQELVNLIKCGFNNCKDEPTAQASNWLTLGSKCKLSKTLKRIHGQQEQEKREEEKEKELLEKDSKSYDGSKSLPSILALSMIEKKKFTQFVLPPLPTPPPPPPPPPQAPSILPMSLTSSTNQIKSTSSIEDNKKPQDKMFLYQNHSAESSVSTNSISSDSGSGASICTIVCKNINANSDSLTKSQTFSTQDSKVISEPQTTFSVTNEKITETIASNDASNNKTIIDFTGKDTIKANNNDKINTIIFKGKLPSSLNLNKKKFLYFDNHRIKSATITSAKISKQLPTLLPNNNKATITTTTTTTTSNFIFNKQPHKSFIKSGFSTLRHSVSFNLKYESSSIDYVDSAFDKQSKYNKQISSAASNHFITSNTTNPNAQSPLASQKLLTLPRHNTDHFSSNKQLTFSANDTTASGIGLVANSMKFPKLINNKSNSTANTNKQPTIATLSNLVLNNNSTDISKTNQVLTEEDDQKATKQDILASSMSSVKEKIMLFTNSNNGCKNLTCSKNSINNNSPSPSTVLLNTQKPPSASNLEHKIKQRPLSQIITMNKNSTNSSAILKSSQLSLSNQSIKSITASPIFNNKISTPTTTSKVTVNQSASSVGSAVSKEGIETQTKNKNPLAFSSSNYSMVSSVLNTTTSNNNNNNNNNNLTMVDTSGSPSSICQSNQSQLQSKNSFKSVKEKIAYFSSNLKDSPTSTIATSKKINRSIEIISTETQNAIQIKRNSPKDWDSLKYAYNSINNIKDSNNIHNNKLNKYQLAKALSTSSNVLSSNNSVFEENNNNHNHSISSGQQNVSNYFSKPNSSVFSASIHDLNGLNEQSINDLSATHSNRSLTNKSSSNVAKAEFKKIIYPSVLNESKITNLIENIETKMKHG